MPRLAWDQRKPSHRPARPATGEARSAARRSRARAVRRPEPALPPSADLPLDWQLATASGPTRILRRDDASPAVAPAIGSAGGDVDPALASRIRRADGRPLEAPTRRRMEAAFGNSFDDVRIHVDSAEAAPLGARAFTLGNDIHFAPGEYQPGRADGLHTLAHELAHVVQQRGDIRRAPDVATVRRLPSRFAARHKVIAANPDTAPALGGVDAWSQLIEAVRLYGTLKHDDQRRSQILTGVKRRANVWRDEYYQRLLTGRTTAQDKARSDELSINGPLGAIIDDERFELDSGRGALDIANVPPDVVADPQITRKDAGEGQVDGDAILFYDRLLTRSSGLNVPGGTKCKVLAVHLTEGSVLVTAETAEQGSLTGWLPLLGVRVDVTPKLTPFPAKNQGKPERELVELGKDYVALPAAMPLFQRAPTVSDVNQGAIGDCYLLAALISIAHSKPKAIVDMMADAGNTVVVRLYDVDRSGTVPRFTPRFVRVRKSVVKTKYEVLEHGKKTGERSAYTYAKEALWVQMVEKAYAAAGMNALGTSSLGATGAYGDIATGFASLAMEHLLGRPAEQSFEAMQTGVGANPALLPRHVFRLPWSTAEIADYERAQSAADKKQAYQGLMSFSIFGDAGKVDAWMTFASKVSVDDEVRKIVSKGTAYKKGEIRLETFATLFEQFGLDLGLSSTLLSWLRANQLYPGKRGTGKYTTNQLELFTKIRNALSAGGYISVSTKPEAGRVVGGTGDSGGEKKSKGIAGGHAYAVLSVRPAKDISALKPNELLWVLLRNPWSRYGRQYEALDWRTSSLKVKKGATTPDTEKLHETTGGEFWVELSDLTKRFAWIDVSNAGH